VVDDRQLRRRDPRPHDPAQRPEGAGAGDEDGHLPAVAGEYLVGVDAARSALRAGVLGGYGGLEFAQRALQPGHRVLGADRVDNRGRLDRRHAAQLDGGRDISGRRRLQQVAQRCDRGLRAAEFLFESAEVGGDPLIARAEVRGGQHRPARSAGREDPGDKMPYFTAPDGTQLFYRDWGAGRPVVFVHGMLLSGEMWQRQLLHLTENGFRAVAYDRRGHGRSDDPGTGYEFDMLAGRG